MCSNNLNYSFREVCNRCDAVRVDAEKKRIGDGGGGGGGGPPPLHRSFVGTGYSGDSSGNGSGSGNGNGNTRPFGNGQNHTHTHGHNNEHSHLPQQQQQQQQQQRTSRPSGGGRQVRHPKQKTEKGTRPGDWECCECANKNYAFRDVCNRCSLPRFLSEMIVGTDDLQLGGAGDAPPTPGSGGGVDGGFPAGSRQAALRQMASEGTAGGGSPLTQRSTRQGGDWDYGDTPQVPPDVSGMHKAAMHRRKGPKGKKKSGMDPHHGDWFCGICGNNNYAFRQECNICATPRVSCEAQLPMSGSGDGGAGGQGVPADDDRSQGQSRHFPIYAAGDHGGNGGGNPPGRPARQHPHPHQHQHQHPHPHTHQYKQHTRQHLDGGGGGGGFGGYRSEPPHELPRYVPQQQQQLLPPHSMRAAVGSPVRTAGSRGGLVHEEYNVNEYTQEYGGNASKQSQQLHFTPSHDAYVQLDEAGYGSGAPPPTDFGAVASKHDYAQQYAPLGGLGGLGGLPGLDVSAASWSHRD